MRRGLRPSLVAAVLATTGLAGAGAGAAAAGTSWTTYHANLSRTGVDNNESSLNIPHLAWSNPLDGAREYGQPVVADGRVFVATEDDNVYALDAANGHVLWSHHVGTPLTNFSGLCGNIDPLGITSTPAIDLARSTLFVAAEVVPNPASQMVGFRVFGFNLVSGAQSVSLNAAPSTADNLLFLQQRAALAVANGRVYVSYGGHDGDCGQYHGWVVGVDETGSRSNVQFNATPNTSGGAIWQGGGGPSVDSAGNLYVTTGNPNSGSESTPYADDVVKLNSNLARLASFHDQLASGDADLGTGDAVLLPNGTLFVAGKTDHGYVLRQSNLTLVKDIPNVCGGDPDGGAAYDPANNTVYVPCRGSGQIQPVNLTTGTAGAQGGSSNGPPILVNGRLWTVDYNDGLLSELDPSNLSPIVQIQLPAVPNFASPSSADGLLLVGTESGVVALAGPRPHPTAGYWLAAGDGGLFSFGTAAFHGSLGDVRLRAPIVGMAPTPTGRGYWLVAADGGVFAFGDAHFYGSTGNIRLARPVVGMAAAPGGNGYWLVASDGGVFSFGPGARFHGSTGGIRLNRPVVGMAADSRTGGYWLVASDGGIFAFDAHFYGSTGGIRLTQPVVAMAAGAGGGGYWMAAADGGVFAFGPAAKFHGSMGGVPLVRPVVGMATDTRTGGYWLVASDGGIFAFDAPFEGSTGGVVLASPVVGMAVP